MKIYVTVVILVICIFSVPLTSSAALDWQIQWNEASPHTAEVRIFNPEDTYQSFTLEVGDVAKTSDPLWTGSFL